MIGLFSSAAQASPLPCAQEGLEKQVLVCKVSHAYADRTVQITLKPASFENMPDGEPWEEPRICGASLNYQDPVSQLRVSAYWDSRYTDSGKLWMYFHDAAGQLLNNQFSSTPAPGTKATAFYSFKPPIMDTTTPRGGLVYSIQFACGLEDKPAPALTE